MKFYKTILIVAKETLGSGAVCSKCHKGGGKPHEVARKMTQLVQQAIERASKAKATVAVAQREGLYLPGTSALVVDMNTAVERLRPALHSLDAQALDRPVGDVNNDAAEVEKIVANARSLRRVERRGYYAAVAMIVVLLLLLVAKGRQLGVWRGHT